MIQIKKIATVAAVSLMVTSCGLYNKYDNKTETPTGLFGANLNGGNAENGTSLGQLSWPEFFTDPLLQQLIEQILNNNTDLNSARIAVEKSEASLKMAKMAYLPSLNFSPQGTVAKVEDLQPSASAIDGYRCVRFNHRQETCFAGCTHASTIT